MGPDRNFSRDRRLTRIYDSPVGPLWITADEEGITRLAFSEEEGSDKGSSLRIQSILEKTIGELDEYFAGRRSFFDIPLHIIRGTPFQRRIWRVLQEDIPYGETVSYAQEAALAGRPRACRAAANANHLNPIAIIIPCHRVIAAGGKIGGYGAGIEKKRFLLDLESGRSHQWISTVSE
ncbi:MAG: methylated-DNA--[protein]-cysteine S-methyltransferase [Prevotella sp.]|jgi:methylated-DNA-[protein]-cysteine S-methyltransferase|nr:methylated-DNA--[protein]-cysteine S-methyltransferase [Prevotella sp.]MCH4018959.1 methylated-DNA--[protein]-cysteine S-methyltransferase [Prevotella sp.]MCI1324250.1 methylated-DNA--[protein]-cysteine S-methyltransferase [Prevotella sp.]MCI1349344.1 methylated-DNA--[protein]-cysteine S-methyltransferase [Prevotella sp.]MCI1416583.1 methylated-DNA--[protein]-cysteine S-methyltransferase [Prevotella sp.]